MKKKYFLIGIIIGCFAAALTFGKETLITVMKKQRNQPVIVVDSGHGGIDPGKVGVSGHKEKDINLSIAKKLKTILELKKISVVMTRTDDRGLYQEGDSNKKIADLRARVSLIEETAPDLCVSIHQNSYGSPTVKGAQVFYYQKSIEGKEMGKCMQEALRTTLPGENHRQEKANSSYYMLCRTKVPFLIVECGFLSNPEEEALLASNDYQNKVAQAIATGIEKCLVQKG